jgi:hypothetical protein
LKQKEEANRIAEKQARPAVILNRLLATFTACTLICVRESLPDETESLLADNIHSLFYDGQCIDHDLGAM